MIGVRYMMIAVLLGAAAVALGDMQEARALFSSIGHTSYLDDSEDNTDYRSVITLKNVVSATDKPFYHWLIEGDSCTNQGTDIDPDWHCEYDSIVGNRVYRINQPTGQNFDASVYDLEYAKSYRWLFADRLEAKENIFAVLELDPTSPPTPRSTENMTLKGRNNVIVDLGSPGYADAGIDHTCGTLPLFDNNIDLGTAGEYHFKYYCGDEVLERSVHVVDLTPPTAVITVVDGQDYSVKHVPTIERGTDLNDGTYKARMVDNDPGFVPAQLYIPHWSSNQEIGYRTVGFWHVAPNDDYTHRHTDAAGLVYQIKYFQAKIVDTTPPVIRPSAGSGTSFDDPIRINVGNSWYDLLQDVEVFEHDHRVRHELDYTGQVWAQHDINFENPGEYTVTYRAPPDAYGNHPVPVTRKAIVGEDYLTIGEVSSNSTHWILPIANPNPSLNYDFFVSAGDEQGSRSEMTLENKILVTPISIPKIGNGDQFVLVRFGPSGQPYTDHAMFTADSDNNLRDLLSYTIANNVLERTDEDPDCADAFGISFSVNSSVAIVGPSLDCDQVDFSTPGIYNVILEVEVIFDIHFSGLAATLETYWQRVAIEVEIVDRTPPQNPWFVEDGDFVRHQLPFGELFNDPGLTSADDHPQHRNHVFHINETVPGPLDIYSPTVTPQYLNYHVADPSGNAAVPDRTPRRSISVQPDTEPPEIRLNGMSPIMLVKDSIAYDPGYTVTDNDPHHDLYENLISNGFIEYFVPPTSRHGAVFTDSDGRQRFHTGTPGIMNITYLARDVKNNEATVTRIVIVRDLPDFPPTTIGDRTVEEHRELSFTVVPNIPDLSSYDLPYERASCADLDIAASSNCIFDPESPVFFLDRNPPGATIHLDTGEFSWTPGENQQGTHEFFINIHYGHKFTRNPVTINVTEVNQIPAIDPIPAQDAFVGQLLAFGINVTDADIPVQDLTYSIVPDTLGAAIQDGEFRWTPADSGNQTFAIVVNDGAEGYDIASFLVTVKDILDVVPMPSEFGMRFTVTANTDIDVKGRLLDPANRPVTLQTNGSAILTPGQSVIFYSPQSEPLRPDEPYTYMFTYEDDADYTNPGLISGTVQTLPDNIRPVITIKDDTTTIEKGGTYREQNATVTDNDPSYASTVTVQSSSVDTSTVGSYTVTYTATPDHAGNIPDPVTETVHVQDTTAPAITLNGDNPLEHELGDTYTDPGAITDDGSAVTADDSAVNINERGDYDVTYTATDDQDNGVTATRIVQVRDTTKPVITPNGSNLQVIEKGTTYTELGAAVTDNDPDYSGTATVQSSTVNADVVGSYRVTYTAPADEAGNTPDPVTRTVTVQDTTASVIVILGDNPLQHELGTPYDDPGATTDDGTPVIADTSAVNINGRGDYHVIYTATDDDGNAATATRTVQVQDTTKPTITISGETTVTVEKGSGYSDQGATVTDNDPNYNEDATGSSNVNTDTVGTYQVTYTAPADEAGNAPDTVTRTVNVEDTTAPIITILGNNPMQHELGDEYDDPGATTNDGTPVTADTSAVNINERGDYLVIYMATDDDGNTVTATRTVQVRDTTKPVITITGDNPLQHELGTPYDDPGATTDDGTPVTANILVNINERGDYPVTYTAIDDSGNTATAIRTVTIRDTAAPTITILGDNPLQHELGTPYDDPGATTDDGTPVRTASTVNADEMGDYTVTYSATDSQGNAATPAIRTVHVRDTTPPAIKINDDNSFGIKKIDTYTEPGAAVSDNDPEYKATVSITGIVDSEVPGMYNITYNAPPDAAGNKPVPITRIVTISDTTPPVLDAVADMDVYIGDLLEFAANATDNGPTLIFSLTGTVPEGARIDEGGAFAWIPVLGQQGIHIITVSVSDGLLSDSQDMTITVKDRNLPPDIPDSIERSVHVNTPISYKIPVQDDYHPDNPNLTFTINGTAPENITIAHDTGVIMWTPTEKHINYTHTFTVSVHDGQYNDTSTVMIQVLGSSDAPRRNDADYKWRKTPTFGRSFNTNEMIVSCGYSMDGTCRDVTDYHVDYKRTVIQTNTTHDFTLKAYGEQVLQLFQIGFGMPSVGAPLNTAEALIEITILPNYTKGSTGYDVADVVYRNPNNVIDQDATFAVYDTDCQDDSELVCVQLNITGVTFREQMYYEPFAIFIMDTDLRSSTFYMNEGLLVEGKSLNPAPTATRSTKSGNQADTITLNLVRTDKLDNIWTDQMGNRWTHNEYGTWMMIYTVPKEIVTACTDDNNRYCDAFGDRMELHTGTMEAIRDGIYGSIYTTPAFDDLEEAVTILDTDGDSRTRFLEQNGMMWIRD